ncbi:MAG: holo-ACP synthase [Gammaproteobacteria bacterium]|nr:holo-ACP synthase [Gammaproteobacteria bacterium]
MIAGIGVDIAETIRFTNLYDRYGERFARRILTDAELEQFHRRSQSTLFLATRFAVKEAAAKSLGTGFTQGISYKSFEVSNDVSGKPYLSFHHAALELIERRQVSNVFVSISDEKNYVVAMIILESN